MLSNLQHGAEPTKLFFKLPLAIVKFLYYNEPTILTGRMNRDESKIQTRTHPDDSIILYVCNHQAMTAALAATINKFHDGKEYVMILFTRELGQV